MTPYAELLAAAKGLETIDDEPRFEGRRPVRSPAWDRYMAAYRRWLAVERSPVLRDLNRVYPEVLG